MRNPFRLPESAEQFLTIEDHLQMNKRINKVLDWLTVGFLTAMAIIFILCCMYYYKSMECDQWHDKCNREMLQDADQMAVYEMLSDSM